MKTLKRITGLIMKTLTEMKKKYTESDEIEIRLERLNRTKYVLLWRFKEPRKFLFFKIKHDWRTLSLYSMSEFDPQEDPNDDHYWHDVCFDAHKKDDVQEYERVKSRIKTKKDLYDYYSVRDRTNLYFDHLKEHRKWVKENME